MAEYKQQPIIVPKFNEDNGFYTTPQRSRTMSRIRGRNTKPEVALRKALFALGYRYRINMKSLPGKPDIVLTKYKLAIFIDGEFWHGHNWEQKQHTIKSNRGFWLPKIARNMQRDMEVNQALSAAGWRVLRFWGDEVKRDVDGCLSLILTMLGEEIKPGFRSYP